MNDFVLRGFCENCWQPIFMNELGEPQHSFGIPCGKVICKQAKWCLSAKQIMTVYESKEYDLWYEMNFNLISPVSVSEMHARFLEREPFLVAKILKEAEKEAENKEENK